MDDLEGIRRMFDQLQRPGQAPVGPMLKSVADSSRIYHDNRNISVIHGPGNINNFNPNISNVFNMPVSDPSDVTQQAITAVLKERHVPNAVYNAQLGKGCMAGTRVQILRDIENWILSPKGQQIFWLAGMAGTGKTAIAQTVCSLVDTDTKVVLGGSFFCSRSAGSAAQRDVRSVIPTLAQLLARQSQEFSQALAAELKRDPDILYKQVAEQLTKLLYTPLLALKDSLVPIVSVIDALDECGGGQSTSDGRSNEDESRRIVSDMLSALVDFSRSSVKVPVKFLVTSRPETHIRDTPVADATFSTVLYLHMVNKEQVAADIRLYISTRLSSSSKLRSRFTDGDTDNLARLCDGLFIVATTALHYILDGGVDAAVSRFKRVLNSTQDSLSIKAAAPLDRMYSFILMDAIRADETETDELQAMLSLLASLLCTRVALSIAALADLLDIDKDDVRARLSRLHAVVHVPDDNDEPSLHTLHASFGDYLVGRAPSNIRFSGSLGHELLAPGCLRVMAERLHFNVSQSRSSYESNPSTQPDTITMSLEYACLQWTYHVASLPDMSTLDESIDVMFRPRLLFWLEVMSVLGKVRRAAAMLLFAAGMVRSPLSQFLRDANAFVASSREAIERSAPHIYQSALPFAAKGSLVYQTFHPLCTGLISAKTFGINHHGGSLMMTLVGHERCVTSVAYSPDGLLVATTSEDATARLWDTRTGEEMMSPLRSGDGAVLSIAYALNGESLATGTDGGFVNMWSLLSDHASLQRLSGHAGKVWFVKFSPSGTCLASASEDKTVRLWQVETGHQVALLNAHTRGVKVITFSSDGTILASGSNDQTIRLWCMATCQPEGQPLAVDGVVRALCFSPDGGKLAAGYTNSTVQLWDLQTRAISTTLRGHTGWIRSVEFSPDGRHIVSASDDRTMRIWTVPQDTNQASSIVLDGHTGGVRFAAISPNGLYIASVSADCTVRIWDARSAQQVVQPLPVHKDGIECAALSSCGRFIVAGSRDCSVHVWDMQNGQPRPAGLLKLAKPVCSLAISSDGHLIGVEFERSDRMTYVWDARTGEAVSGPLAYHLSNFPVAFSPDSRWFASTSISRGRPAIRMWNVATTQRPRILQLGVSLRGATAIAFSPDGRLLAAGRDTGGILLWHTNTGESAYQPLRANSCSIRSIAFSPKDLRIVAGGDDEKIRIWEIDKERQLLLLENHNSPPLSVAFSPSGGLICSGSEDHTVRIWNAETGAPIATLLGHTDAVKSMSFTPDGRFVVSCSRDTTIRVWDIDTARDYASGSLSNPVVALASATFNKYWLVGPSGELLLWVPVSYRPYLQLPPCTLRIDRSCVAVTIGDGGWHRGTNWSSCWRENAPNLGARTT